MSLLALIAFSSPAPPLAFNVPAGVHGPNSEWWISYRRELGTRKANRPFILRFRKGYHQLTMPLEIDAPSVTVEGEPGARLAGGPRLTQWGPVSDPSVRDRLPNEARPFVKEVDLGRLGIERPSLFSPRGFSLPMGLSHTELFADGVPLRPARYPNVDAPNDGWLLTGTPVNGGSFTGDDRPGRWKNLENVWAYGYWQFDWADSWEAVSGYDATQRVTKLANANATALRSFGLAKGRRFFYSHVLEELDQPGEYWIDVARNRLVAWIPKGAKELTASELGGPLIRVLKGKDVIVRDLELHSTRGAAIEVQDSENVMISRVRVRNAGAQGVTISGGRACGIRNSQITNTAGAGVALSGGDRRTLTPGAHFVERTRITNIARWSRTYQPAVNLDGVGHRVVGNTMTDMPHCAILFGGNDHLIELNDIRRVCQETSDSGAIYIGRDATTRGTMIRWNRFRDIEVKAKTEGNFHMVMSVYLDDCQAGISVIGNIFEANSTAIMIGGGRDNVVEGNVFLGSDPGIHFDMRARGWAKEHFAKLWGYQDRIKAVPVLESPWRERYPKLYADIKNNVDLSYAGGNRVAKNVVAAKRWIEYLDGLTVKDLDYENNEVINGPFTLKDALAKVKAKGMPIPLERIGAGK